MRARLLPAVAAVAAALALSPFAAGAPSAYDDELARLDRETAAAGPDRLVHLLFARASLTADFADLGRAEEAIEREIGRAAGASAEELLLFRATLHVQLHRLSAAEDDLARLTRLAGSPQARLLAADLALQRGRYAEARRSFEELAEERRTWDRLARLAYLERRTGRAGRADALYAEAQEGLTAKEMRAFAWLELQRGLIDLDRGRHRRALAHYRRAERAYSGHWLIDEHVAEALALLGRTEEAAALYQRVIERTGNPEYLSALASLVAGSDPAAAAALEARADALFAERFRRFPEAAIGHYVEHLVERTEAPPELLALAERNHELRPNAESKLLLARACARLGQRERARELLAEIAATPWRSPALRVLARRLAR